MSPSESLMVKTLDEEMVSFNSVIDGQKTVVVFLRHFG